MKAAASLLVALLPAVLGQALVTSKLEYFSLNASVFGNLSQQGACDWALDDFVVVACSTGYYSSVALSDLIAQTGFANSNSMIETPIGLNVRGSVATLFSNSSYVALLSKGQTVYSINGTLPLQSNQ